MWALLATCGNNFILPTMPDHKTQTGIYLIVNDVDLGCTIKGLCWLLSLSVPKSGSKQSRKKPSRHLTDA